MKPEKPLLYAWIAVVVSLLFLLLTSCELFHKMGKSESRNTDLKKDDSVHVKKSESGSELEADWQRKMWLFPNVLNAPYTPSQKDTVTNTIRLQPEIYNHYSTQPVMYVEESGKVKQNIWAFNLDSFKRAIVDSMQASVKAKETTTKGEALSTMQILGLLGIAVVVAVILSKIKISF